MPALPGWVNNCSVWSWGCSWRGVNTPEAFKGVGGGVCVEIGLFFQVCVCNEGDGLEFVKVCWKRY